MYSTPSLGLAHDQTQSLILGSNGTAVIATNWNFISNAGADFQTAPLLPVLKATLPSPRQMTSSVIPPYISMMPIQPCYRMDDFGDWVQHRTLYSDPHWAYVDIRLSEDEPAKVKLRVSIRELFPFPKIQQLQFKAG